MRGSRVDPDPQLIRRAQGGEREALQILLAEVSPAIRQWALASTGDPDDAADLAQDVLFLLVRKLGSYKGRARFLTWLFSVTRNQALEARRRDARHRRKMARLATEVRGRMSTEGPDEAKVDRQRVVALISTYLEDLPERQREVFQLADLQGLTSPEIANLLEVEPGTVRAALFKARRTLRTKILRERPELVEEYLT